MYFCPLSAHAVATLKQILSDLASDCCHMWYFRQEKIKIDDTKIILKQTWC